jgi:hypothetical protein
MRKSANEIIRNLEMRIARLESENAKTAGVMTVNTLNPYMTESPYGTNDVEVMNTQDLPSLLFKSDVSITRDGLQAQTRDGLVHTIEISKDEIIKALLPLAKPASVKMR